MTSPIGSRHGFTLIEVLVSLAILGLGAVTVLQALARIAHAQALTAYQANAYLFAVSKMGDVEVAFREGKDIHDQDTGSFHVGPRNFQWELVATPVVEAPGVRAVSLTVRWRAGQQAYARRFETQLREPLPEQTS